jgi:hypothetical protein
VIRAITPASEEAGYSNAIAQVQKVTISHKISTEPDGF